VTNQLAQSDHTALAEPVAHERRTNCRRAFDIYSARDSDAGRLEAGTPSERMDAGAPFFRAVY